MQRYFASWFGLLICAATTLPAAAEVTLSRDLHNFSQSGQSTPHPSTETLQQSTRGGNLSIAIRRDERAVNQRPAALQQSADATSNAESSLAAKSVASVVAPRRFVRER